MEAKALDKTKQVNKTTTSKEETRCILTQDEREVPKDQRLVTKKTPSQEDTRVILIKDEREVPKDQRRVTKNPQAKKTLESY